jgi:hypothetical protein
VINAGTSGRRETEPPGVVDRGGGGVVTIEEEGVVTNSKKRKRQSKEERFTAHRGYAHTKSNRLRATAKNKHVVGLVFDGEIEACDFFPIFLIAFLSVS